MNTWDFFSLFVVFDMFLAPFTFSDGGCAVVQRYLLSFVLRTLVD